MPTEAQLETLSTALDAYHRADAAVRAAITLESATGEIRAINRLIDAVADIDGYARAASFATYADLAEHAAGHVTRWLLSGVA